MTTGRINQITYCFLVLTANRFRFTEVKLLSAAIAVLLGLELPKPRPELTHATVSRLQTTAPRARRPGLLKSRAHAARVLKYRPKGKRTILYARLIFTTPSSSEKPRTRRDFGKERPHQVHSARRSKKRGRVTGTLLLFIGEHIHRFDFEKSNRDRQRSIQLTNNSHSDLPPPRALIPDSSLWNERRARRAQRVRRRFEKCLTTATPAKGPGEGQPRRSSRCEPHCFPRPSH